MNLRKTLITILAAVGLMMSFAAPVALAQTANTTATVTVTSGGDFIPYFCEIGGISLGSAQVSSAAGSTANGVLRICYVDTKAYRQGFTTTLLAGNFNSGITQQEAGAGVYSIPATGFTITTVYNPVQDQYRRTNPAHPAGTCPFMPGTLGQPGVYDIGDIGAYSNNGSGAVTGGSGTPWTGGNLSAAKTVNYAWNGTGTGNGGACADGLNGTYSRFDVALAIPQGAYPTSYVSQITLSVTVGQP